MVMILFPREGMAPEIPVTKSVRINEVENIPLVGFIAPPTELLSHVTVDSAMCREFESHRPHLCLFQACALKTLWMIILVVVCF